MRRLWLVVIALILLLGAAGGSALIWQQQQMQLPSPITEPTIVVIEPGWGVIKITYELEKAGVIPLDWTFRRAVQQAGLEAKLKAGQFEFQPEWTVADVANHLANGQPVSHSLTIPEGLTAVEIAALINTAPELTGDPVEPPPEGSILPETWQYARGDTRAAMLNRMTRAQSRLLTELWENRAADLPLETPEQAVILASIVEKETGIPDERRRVAGVFINRLNKGMRLQSDPTVIYGLTEGRAPLGRLLTRADWRHDSAFNTYRIKGLPPAPIAAPGRAAIEAVLNPEQHDYLFFVADSSGGHAFSETLEQHNANIRRFRR